MNQPQSNSLTSWSAELMEQYLLKLLKVFAWAYKLMRVDFGQLQAIVAVKLLTDNRRQHISYRRASQGEKSNAFTMTLFFYSIFGVFVAFGIFALPSFIFSMIVFFSYLMVMVAMTLITDFSTILLDTSDNTIILPRPVDGRTLFVARITHIMLYLGQLAIALSLAPMIAVLMEYGITLFLLFLLGILLSIMTSVFITNASYLLILQFANEEKLKNIINYFQIVMAVCIMGGYQILPRIIERLDIDSFVFEVQWWNFLLPPVWIAAALEAVYKGLTDIGHLGLALFSLVIPPTGLFLVNTHLTPLFSRKLGAIGGVDGKERIKSKKHSFIDNISQWITFSQLERGAFDLVYKILGRDRKIKLKVYPTFGYIAIFGLIFLMRGKNDLETTWSNLPYTHLYLMLMYMTFMILQIALYEIPYTDDFKASWVYFSTPLDSPGEILSGMLKAIFVRLFLPGYFVIGAFVFFIWGNQVVDDLVFGLFNNFLMFTILATVNKRHLPLSMAPHLRSQAGNLLRGLLTFLIMGILCLFHYVLTKKPFLLLGAVPFQLGLIYFLVRRYKRTRWEQISS